MAAADEFSSITGSSALMCVDHAPNRSVGEKRSPKGRRRAPGRLLPRDAVLDGTCVRCGIVGEHRTAQTCIEAFRSEIATMEFKLERHGKSTARFALPVRHS